MKNLTPLTLAITTLLSTSVLADDHKKEPLYTLYGKVNVGLQYEDDGDDTFSDVESYASRIGVKGKYKLDDGMTVIYKYEWQVNINDEKDETLSDRDQYIGLKGSLGTIQIGRNTTALKASQGKVDQFNDFAGDIKHLWKAGGNGENRMKDSLHYASPNYSGFSAQVTYITEASADGEDGISAAIVFGDAKLKKSKIFASVAIDSEVKGYDVTRATLQGKLGKLKLGGVVQMSEPVDGDEELTGVMVSAAYPFGNLTIKGQVQTAEFDLADYDKTSASIGADYKLGKMTKAYTWATGVDNDNDGEDTSVFAVGLVHKF